MPQSWTDRLECSACGTRFRSAIAEAKHRHSFPVMCKRNKQFREFVKANENGTS